MNKKIIIGFAVALFSTFAWGNNAFAGFDSIYTVGSSGSATLKDNFSWNEQPYLYLKLPDSPLTYSVSWWNLDSTSLFYNDWEITTGSNEVWHTLDNWFAPSGPRQLGEWNIRADYSSAAGFGSANTNFTVTPEPVSSILFLIGGASLATSMYRKRKIENMARS